ncbi:hypothetical protein [Shimia sp. R9_3]|uniref:hypothetical protein n=1 Tax=Shimia sp. R9_3 TaxID=2821113 RepID=UPI001ADC4B88|nr:hypothetical protein [Shimia sp. R9_3]MBO9401565.1 hypothetical protein [Shimia sp. R9_3]
MSKTAPSAFFTLPATLALAATLSTLSASAAAKQDLATLLATYGSSWASHDMDALVALQPEDTAFRLVAAGINPAQDNDSLNALLAALYAAAPPKQTGRKTILSGAHYTALKHDLTVDAETVVPGCPRRQTNSEASVILPALDVLVFENGLIKEKITYLDVKSQHPLANPAESQTGADREPSYQTRKARPKFTQIHLKGHEFASKQACRPHIAAQC